MEFCEFAQRMHKIIGGASNTAAFVKTLFETIISEENYSILEETNIETYKSYFNGHTGISRFAKKISLYIDQEEFVSYCDELEDSVVENLCKEFADVIPDITLHNASVRLAELFKSIILDAAGKKRKSATKHKAADEYIEAEVVDDNEPSGAAEEDKKITVIQHQTNVIQHGEKNINLTNNGTINLNF